MTPTDRWNATVTRAYIAALITCDRLDTATREIEHYVDQALTDIRRAA